MRRLTMLLAALVALALPGAGTAQSGQDYGDLIEILRDVDTARPILQKRWIEYPGDVFDWGYCPIPIDAAGEEVPFLDLTCDPDPLQADRVIEVDYFGRLNAGRTDERNMRMHFNETINQIRDSEVVDLDPVGRLNLGTSCWYEYWGEPLQCKVWKTIDSPMENLSLYRRLLKYGHLQTDPLELDPWWHGDPSLPPQYHPALRAEDWPKFSLGVRHLLPFGGVPTFAGEPVAARADTDRGARLADPLIGCFSPVFPDGFDPACALPEPVEVADFVSAASHLGGAADKTGKITPDLVAYENRILDIPVATDYSAAPLSVLPALIRLEDLTTIVEATPGLPAPADELFVDYSAARYMRSEWRDEVVEVLHPLGEDMFQKESEVPLPGWLHFINGPEPDTELTAATAFVAAASDGLRCVEFMHNYEVPADLGWDFKW